MAAILLAMATAGTAAAKEPMGVIDPFDPHGGEPTHVTLSLTMDGEALPGPRTFDASDFDGYVVLAFREASTGEVVRSRAEFTGTRWEATVTFPRAGTWTADGWLQLGDDRLPFASLSGMTEIEVSSSPVVAAPIVWGIAALGLAALVLLYLGRGRGFVLRRAHVNRQSAA